MERVLWEQGKRVRLHRTIDEKSACGNPNSAYHPTLDHIRPVSAGGCDILGNIEICHRDTNEEKADRFPYWKANGNRFRAERIKGSRTNYKIVKL